MWLIVKSSHLQLFCRLLRRAIANMAPSSTHVGYTSNNGVSSSSHMPCFSNYVASICRNGNHKLIKPVFQTDLSICSYRTEHKASDRAVRQHLLSERVIPALYHFHNMHTCSSYLRNNISPVPSVTPLHFIRISRWISRKTYQFPVVLESDLEESFVHGSGPGGQSVNKTSNCVVLKHLPSCIVIKCHETRSLDQNRKRARQHLLIKLDNYINGENSFEAQQQREEQLKHQERRVRTRKNLERKKAFKDREGLD